MNFQPSDPQLEIRSGLQARAVNRKIEGYAIVFNSPSHILPGGFREIIKPEAVQRSLKGEWNIFALYNHDFAQPLASTETGRLTLKADSRGLYVVIDPTPTSYANDLITNISEGVVPGMSFRFKALPGAEDWVQGEDAPVRVVKDMVIPEVSVVTVPAYEDTTVAVRSLEEYRKSQGSKLAHYKLMLKQVQ